MIQIKAPSLPAEHRLRMWHRVATAPFNLDLELAVIDAGGPHSLVFPCRRILCGWVDAETQHVEVRPAHWREWEQTKQRL
jgi:hypothetical protein